MEKGVIIEERDLIKKIIECDNKKIIDYIYENIENVKWEHEELLQFMKKNNFPMDNKTYQLL